jgi:hypothetical protein
VRPLIMTVLLAVTRGVAAMTFAEAAEALRVALAADSPLPSVPPDAPCRPRMVTPFHRPTCVFRARDPGTNRYGLIGDEGRDPSGAVLPPAWQVGVGWGLALFFSFSSPLSPADSPGRTSPRSPSRCLSRACSLEPLPECIPPLL